MDGKKINSDLKSLIFIFSRNKAYIFPIAVILVSLLFLLQFVIPQFNTLLAIQQEAKNALLKRDALKANFDVLSNVNDEILDSQLKALKLALPGGKDFIGVLNSIYLTSQKTGVNIGSFSLKIGDISQTESGDNFKFISITLPINSSVMMVNNFVDAISKSLPLAEVNSVRIGNASSTVNLSFYYKSIAPFGHNLDAPINPISQMGLTVISQLNVYNNNGSSPAISVMPVATSSATK